MSQPTPVNRRSVLTMLGGSVAAPMLASRTAFAQEAWPTRQVRYVNGFPAGWRHRHAVAHSSARR